MKSSKMFLTRLAGVAAGAVVALGIAGAAHAQSPVEFRIATLAPEGSSWMKIFDKGNAELQAKTNSRVKIKYYPGGTQGDEKDVVARMQLKQLDGGAMTSVGLSLIDKSIRVLELPAMFKDVGELDYVRKKMWPTFRARFAKKGYHLGEPGDVGFLYFYSTKPIKSFADLSSIKVWLWGEDKIVKTMFKKGGISGVPMGVPEVLTALTTKRIQAAYTSPLAAVALGWYTKVRYSTSMHMAYGIGATLTRMEAWEKVSPEDKKVAEKVLKIQAQKIRKTVRADNAIAAKKIAREGVQVIETPAAMVAEFEKRSQEVWNELAGDVYSKEDLANVLKYRDEYRAKHASK